MSDLISIIIPCYNVEKYIERCMESVLNQTYKNLEIILVDDGSTDRTRELLGAYCKKDERVFLFKQKNKGAGAARNAGLNIARGRYIGFVDSDDWIEPDMYEYLAGIIEKENADIAACDFYTVNAKREKRKCVETEHIRIMNNNELMCFFFRVKGEKSFYSVWNMLYKRDIIKDCRFLEGDITEDMFFNYQVYCQCERYALSNQKKYYYFSNPNGVTRTKLGKKDLALLGNWDSIVDDIRNRKPEMDQYAIINRWRADYTLLSKKVLYGYDKNEINYEVLNGLLFDLRKHRKALLNSGMLDWKRRILLVYICSCTK